MLLLDVDEQDIFGPDLPKPVDKRGLPAARSALIDAEYRLFAASRLTNGCVKESDLFAAAGEKPGGVAVPLV